MCKWVLDLFRNFDFLSFQLNLAQIKKLLITEN
jgi:hypothetical protein